MRLDPAWRALDGIFGGYVIATLAQAAAEVEGYEPLSIAVQFLGGVRPGECRLQVDVPHRGASTAAVELALVQDHLRATAVARLGRDREPLVIDERLALAGEPAPLDLAVVPLPFGPFAYEEHIDIRLIPDPEIPWSARSRQWVRVDPALTGHLERPALACLLLDTPPPGLFFTTPSPAFVPTVDFSAHFAPAEQWAAGDWMYLVRHTRWATRTFCLEDAALYTTDGRLVARASQTRRVRWAEGAGPDGRRADG